MNRPDVALPNQMWTGVGAVVHGVRKGVVLKMTRHDDADLVQERGGATNHIVS